MGCSVAHSLYSMAAIAAYRWRSCRETTNTEQC
jgi:hypothetical protein